MDEMNKFNIVYDGWDPDKQMLREALCTLGNGYFAVRGAAEESKDDDINYPGTYLAGGFNRAKTEISGEIIENEDFVNFPNWLVLSIKTEGEEWLNFNDYALLSYTQTLKMKEGTLERVFKVQDKKGRITHIITRRFVSIHNMHLAAIQWKIIPENWSGQVYIKTALDGTIKNNGVKRYRKLEGRHLEPISADQTDTNIISLKVQTIQSKLVMAQASRINLYSAEEEIFPEISTSKKEAYIEQLFDFHVKEGNEYILEKTAAIFTSRDKAVSEPLLEASDMMKEAGRFNKLLAEHSAAFDRLWNRFDIEIEDGVKIQRLLRLHIFHVMQTVSFHSIGMDVGVPSRGLHGEAYRGHIFWDEIYILPFLNFRFPEITRSLLMYRYNRLNQARRAASIDGYKGAMFPWQSGSNGREESQVIHLNPESGRWIPDTTYLQRHINSAIAYNIWNYFLVSDDRQFLSFYGAEIFLSIALYWGSKCIYNSKRDRYEIHNVVGPDEYHTNYPGSKEQGLNNNAYTNVMAAWVLRKALDLLNLIEDTRKKEILKELNIEDKELNLWDEISKKMYIPFIGKEIIAQFEGYESLKEFPWKEYEKKYDNIQRLDRILESEHDSTDNYKVSKQADVLMLFYLFSQSELEVIFARLGYEFRPALIKKNIEYYNERTSHGSTLSRFVFSWIQAKYDHVGSWENFETLLISDFEDIQGGTTPEGIHLGAMSGSLDLVQRCYSGIEVIEDVLWIRPELPSKIKSIRFRINYRRHWIAVEISQTHLTILFEEGWSNLVNIGVADRIYEFSKGETREFTLNKPENLL